MIQKLLIRAWLFIVLSSGLWGQTYTWTGAVDGNWGSAGNWDITGGSGSVPFVPDAPYHDVVIDGGAAVVNLDIDARVRHITVSNGGSLRLRGHVLTVHGSWDSVSGRLDAGASTVIFAASGLISPGAASNFNNVQISGSYTIGADTSAAGNVTINTGASLALGSGRLSAANITNNGTISTVSGEIISSGAVTSTGGRVSGDMLVLSGGGSFTFDNPNNAITALLVADAGGAVVFANNASLGIAGINAPGQVVTLASAGQVSQAGGIITADEARISAGGGINLGLNNAVRRVQLSNTGSGSIIFTNNHVAGLTVSAANTSAAAYGGDIAITEMAGGITVAAVNAVHGISSNRGFVTLTAGGTAGTVVFAAGLPATMNAQRLTVTAGAGASGGAVVLNSSISASAAAGTEAIVISAGTVTLAANMAISSPAGDIHFYLDSFGTPAAGMFLERTTAANGRIFIGARTQRDLEYGPVNTISGAVWIYSNVDIPGNPPLVLSARANAGIFIVDVGLSARKLRAETVTGNIEIRGIYDSTVPAAADNPFLLEAGGSGEVRLAAGTSAAHVILRSNRFTVNAPVRLSGSTVGISAAGITLGGAVNGTAPYATSLNLNGGGGTISIAGPAGGGIQLGGIVVTNTSAAAFNGAINAASFSQNTGDALFAAAQNYSGAFLFTGNNLTLAANAPLASNAAVTITNSGTFTQSAGADIHSTGAFLQNGTGGNTVGANITAGAISFSTLVSLSSNAAFATSGDIVLQGAAAGLVAVTNNAGANRNLSLSAGGTGSVILGRSADTAERTVNLAAGTLSVDAAFVTSAAAVPLNIGTGTAATGLSISARTSFNPRDTLTVWGTAANSGTINAAAPASGSYSILFNGSYFGSSGTINGSGSTNRIVFNGTHAEAGSFEHDGIVVLRGAHAAAGVRQRFSHTVSLPLRHVRIENRAGTIANIVELGSNVIQANDALLEFADAAPNSASQLHLGAFFWQMGGSGIPAAGTFVINSGELIFSEGAALHTGHFTAPDVSAASSPYTITFNGRASVYASGNVRIGSNVNMSTVFSTGAPDARDLNFFTLIMNGGHASRQQITVGSSSHIGSLRLTGNGTNAVLMSAVEIRGDIDIEAGTKLEAGSGITIRVIGYFSPAAKRDRGARWFQADAAHPLPGGVFVPNNSTVEFGTPGNAPDAGRTFRIVGNTEWHILACHEPLADILFSNYPHKHTINRRLDVEPLRDADTLETETDLTRMIMLSRYTNHSVHPPPVDGNRPYIPPMSPNEHFWYFVLSPGMSPPAELHLHHVFITYSFSRQPIPLSYGDLETFLVVAFPYHSLSPHPGYPDPTLGNPRDPNKPLAVSMNFSYFNVNWFMANEFFYSFTEDSNRNGRIDRIRAQAAFELMHGGMRTSGYYGPFAFELFDVEVAGYTIDRSRGIRGFQRVDEITGDPNDSDSIFIFLEERPYSDAGATPRWRVTINESLLDGATRSIPIGIPAHGWHSTFDTVPPRINYALALPGHPELFFQISEPVLLDEDVYFDGALTGSRRLRNIGQGNEFLVALAGTEAYTLQQLAAGDQRFRLGNVRDGAPFIPDRRNGPEEFAFMFPSPRYPLDWDYSGYVEIRDWLTAANSPTGSRFQTMHPGGLWPLTRDWNYSEPGFRMGNLLCGYTHGLAAGVFGSGEHRVSDLLISIPPQRRDEDRYFVWPLWARYEDRPDSPDGQLGWDTAVNSFRPGHGYMGPAGSGFTDTTIIWDFTGKRFLEHDTIVMQSRLGDTLTGQTLTLIFAFDVPDGYKSDSGHSSPGLWLPAISDFISAPALPPAFFGMVPGFLPAGVQPVNQVPGQPLLFNHRFDETNTPQRNTVVEFFYQLSGTPPNLLAGRLDISPGSAIPADWFRRLRPFSFGIHGITRQRSGVTILNNVINSSRRERVFLDFRLLRPGRVTIQVFTLDGTLVRVLEQGHRPASGDRYHRVYWDGTNNAGRPVARGMYFIRVVAPDIDEIRKVMVVR